jgi:hypothetical protein
MSKNQMLVGGIVIVVTALLLWSVLAKDPIPVKDSSKANLSYLESYGEIMLYKSENCVCCDLYANYLKSKGKLNVKVIEMHSISSIKERYGIPAALESCHTTIIGDYFIEGHVPLEAIDKLMTEKPDIEGIALPDMPSGSPGMPGGKNDPFIIYAVDNEGSYSEFMRL